MRRKNETAVVALARKRVRADESEDSGHGNWKIVYADFATALMAFFLLLWIGAASTDEQRDMLADYFNPASVSRANSGAEAPLAGRSVDTIGAMTSPSARGETAFPVASPPSLREFGTGDARDEERERAALEAVEADLRAAIVAAHGTAALNSVAFRQTQDGLLIDIMDQPGQPMFAAGRARLTSRAEALVAIVGSALKRAPNEIRLTGHTDAAPTNDRRYDNLDLSVDRARAARRALVEAGLAGDRVARLEGAGPRDALQSRDPSAARHRRVTIAVLRRPAPSLGLIEAP